MLFILHCVIVTDMLLAILNICSKEELEDDELIAETKTPGNAFSNKHSISVHS